MSSISWEYAASVLWPTLTNAARTGDLLSYEQLAPAIGQPPINVGLALGPIQRYCLDSGLPPLTVLVGDKHTLEPGEGFVGASHAHIEEAREEVRQFDWSSQPNPFFGFSEEDSIESLGDRVVQDPAKRDEVYAKVKVRGVAQRVFKQALVEAYDGACAVCGLTFESALEAAHIIPWGQAEGPLRVDPRNGVLLCALHHSLFDDGTFSISKSLKIMYYDPRIQDGEYTDSDRNMVADFHGIEILKPDDRAVRPDPQLLARRNQKLGFRNIP